MSSEPRFTRTHEWARVEGDTGIVTVGVSRYAAEQLGEIVFVELPAVGSQLEARGPFAVVESSKAAVELCSPVSGEVVEVNQALVDCPEVLGEDPCAKGWMMKVKAVDLAQLETLMSKAEYEAQLQGPDNDEQGRRQ